VDLWIETNEAGSSKKEQHKGTSSGSTVVTNAGEIEEEEEHQAVITDTDYHKSVQNMNEKFF
jgi:hypothetical protein